MEGLYMKREIYIGSKGFIENYKGVWVLCEQSNGIINEVTLELLGKARELADFLGVKTSAILIGKNVINLSKTLIEYGADNVYFVDDPSLTQHNDEVYADIIEQLVIHYKPEILLIGATLYGRSLAPRIASKLNTGLTADCTELSIDLKKKILLQKRPAFGGNVMATIVCENHRPQMATVRPQLMKMLNIDKNRVGNVIKAKVNIPKNAKIKVLDTFNKLKRDKGIKDAEIIVSAGMGLGDRKNLELIKELAEVLGGAVGATRPVVEAGWLNYEHQIGQTGKAVRPKVYFACGISGAVQHLVGMSSSDTVIAINKDKTAPIFNVSKYGIVGDVIQVLSALIDQFKKA